MKVGINPSALKRTTWKEYAIRFLFGGLVTALVGVIATRYGPVVGGLFLAFPAIFPASLTLVEHHKAQAEKRRHQAGRRRGCQAAGVSAAGAAMASLGMAGFGAVVWHSAPRLPAWPMLALALFVWALVSGAAWIARQKFRGRIISAPPRATHTTRG